MDSRLHDLIADSCGNAFLAKEIGRLKILFRVFRDVAWEHDEARNDYPPPGRGGPRAPGHRRGAAGRRPEGGRPRHGPAHPLRRPLLEPGHAAGGKETGRQGDKETRQDESKRHDDCINREHAVDADGRWLSLSPCLLVSLSRPPGRPTSWSTTATSGRSWRRTASPATAPDSAARKADLRLDRRDDAVKAGAIVPGKPGRRAS